jgi:glycine betaine/proline transport system ATP-binding protein
MTVRTAMRAASAEEAGGVGGAGNGPAVAPGATVSAAIEAVARAGVPARVVDQGRCVGMVDSDTLLGVVAGTGARSAAGTGAESSTGKEAV